MPHKPSNTKPRPDICAEVTDRNDLDRHRCECAYHPGGGEPIRVLLTRKEDIDMPAQSSAHTTNPTLRVVPNRRAAASVTPHEIAAVIDDLAARIKADGNCDMYAGWVVATLASKLGIVFALSSSTSPVGAIRDLGEDWADAISRALDEHPTLTAQVLRAAMGVIEQVAADVKARGLAG